MRSIGRLINTGRTLEGDISITLALYDEDIQAIEKLKEDKLVIDISRFSDKRGLNANKYFWKLCDLIAKKLGSDKDTIYLLQLSKYGVFVDIDIHKDAIDALKEKFRYVQELSDGYDTERITARCYFGSSQYTKKEMSELIDGTVNDANDLGIQTITDEEVNRLIRDWEANK